MVQFIQWMRDDDVCGEAAGMAAGGRVLDLVVTYCGDGTFTWEVVDACDRIASGAGHTAEDAKRECENAARIRQRRAA